MTKVEEYEIKLQAIINFMEAACPIVNRLKAIEKLREDHILYKKIVNIQSSIYHKRRVIKRFINKPMLHTDEQALIFIWNRKLDGISRSFLKISLRFQNFHNKLQNDYISDESITLSSKLRELFLQLLNCLHMPVIID